MSELNLLGEDQVCPFCVMPTNRVTHQNDLAYAVQDGFPVTPFHSLVISMRHLPDYFSLTPDELIACNTLIHRIRDEICAKDKTVLGFNIGANCGATAGQTIFHCHIHLIPRRQGDVEEPRGGTRHVIPGKGSY